MSDERRRATDYEMVELKVKVGHIEGSVERLETKVDGLLAFMNQSKGGWKVIVLVAGVAGTAGALAAKLFPFLGGLPK